MDCCGNQKGEMDLKSHPDHDRLTEATTTTSVNINQNATDDITAENATSAWPDITSQDARDMRRLGKKQEFKRTFRMLSTLGFVSIYMATWEFVLVSLSVGFANGGFAGLFWCYLTTVFCYATIVASLAEMASMAPTAGGQYHWVSEFAPPNVQRVLSYAAGWTSTLGWIASVASGNYVVAVQIEAMVQVIRPEFVFTSWQLTLLMLAFTAILIVLNTWGALVLPGLETASLFGHILGFLVVMIPLVVLCPKNSAYEVFVNFQSSNGYNIGTAYLISQVSVMYCNLGSDSIVHISEEVEDASLVVPRCMWLSYLGNITFGIFMLIVMLFCLGPLEDVIDSSTPYLTLFNRTRSQRFSIALNVILFILIFVGNVTAMTTCSREVFAFARDKGLPFSTFTSKMDYEKNVPINSVYVTSIFVGILAFIQLGSTIAFEIIVSLSLLGLLSTYMMSIGCVLWRRVRGEGLPPARWSLGRFGTPINAFAFLYSAFIIVFSCFPTSVPVNMETINWAPVVWVAVIAISAVVYIMHGRRHYTAPVEFVEGRKADGVGLQSS